jgi:hypothetical protein
MMKNYTFLFILSLFSCGQVNTKQEQSPGEAPVHKGWKTIDDPNYAIQYPSNWNMDTGGLMGATFFLLAPPDSIESNIRENINLMIHSNQGTNVDLQQFIDLSRAGVQRIITNANIIESEIVKNGSGEYGKMIYTGEQGGMHLEFEQYYLLTNDKTYIMTLTTPQDRFVVFQATGEAILNTFRLK